MKITILSGALTLLLSAAALAADARSETEEDMVRRRCEQHPWPVWDCECILQRFAVSRAADAKAPPMLLLGKIYEARHCYDRDRAVTHFSGVPCKRTNAMARFGRRPEADCTCFANKVADKIAQHGAHSFQTVARLQAQAGSECGNR